VHSRPMNIRIFLLASAMAGITAAQTAPIITSVQNAASNIPQGLPNAAIAQGSMFVIKGQNLGPTTPTIASGFPLQTTLAGTSVQVTVGDRPVPAIMYSTSSGQVAAILPSTTFAG